MKSPKPLTVHEVQYLAHTLAQEMMKWNEPIPDFETRYPGKLESCLSAPFQTFGSKELYPSFIQKAAALFYLMIKNHPFENGNKRLAVTTLLVFLHQNNKWLTVHTNDLYEFSVLVAESKADYKDQYLQIIQKFISTHIADAAKTQESSE